MNEHEEMRRELELTKRALAVAVEMLGGGYCPVEKQKLAMDGCTREDCDTCWMESVMRQAREAVNPPQEDAHD